LPCAVNGAIVTQTLYANTGPQGKAPNMLRLIKYLLYFLVLCGLIFIAFTYLGPIFGLDFSAHITEIEIPVNLNVN
jgi:hypothetical protein